MIEGIDESIAIERADHIFSTLDTNNDAEICEEEFISGCLQDEEICRILEED